MSVICCRIPNFLLTLTGRHRALPPDQPFALMGPGDLIWAVSPAARRAGVRSQMPPRQAQARCPDLQFHPLDLVECQSAQAGLVDTLTAWELPVEESSWGCAYLDLHQVATTQTQVKPLAVQLGRQVRAALGTGLQPALGWDSGKFTARAASACAKPGHVKLVSQADESPFLSPLSITLLPLPFDALQQLKWLGIRTLGQFAGLPPAAVWQRFGAAGRMAQQWAQGHDPRPVQANVRQSFAPLVATLDPPTGLLDPALDLLLALLRPHLQSLAAELAGCRRLHLQLTFVDGSERMAPITFVTPIDQERPLRAALSHHLQTITWPAELDRLAVTGLETGELVAQQIPLFPEYFAAPDPAQTIVPRLRTVYGPIFFQGKVHDPAHPVAERGIAYQEWT